MGHEELGTEKIKVSVKLNDQDVLHMYKVHTKLASGKFYKVINAMDKIFTSLFISIILLIVIYVGILYLRTPNTSDSNINSGDLLLYGFTILLYPLLYIACYTAFSKLIKRKILKDFKSNREAQNDIDYTISNDELTVQSISSYSYHDWSSIVKVVETNQVFALYLSNNLHIVLPKRFFIDEMDIYFLRDMLKEKYQNKYSYVGSKKEK